MPIPDKERYTYVYHPSVPHKERWEKAARKAHTSLSKFIIAAVDGMLDENEEFMPRREIMRELESSRAENKALRDDLRQKSIVIERYEAELKRHRSQAFMEDDFRGQRRYSRELADILRKGTVDSYRLLEELGIDPRESDLVKAVSKELEELEGFGVVKTDGRSWQWIG